MTQHFLAMLLLASAPLSIFACTQTKIQACMEGTMFDGENIGQVQQGGLNTAQTREQIEKVCSDYQIIKACLTRFQHECDSTTALSLDTVTGTYDYVCGEGKERMLRNLDCYNKPAVKTAVFPCLTTYQRRMASLARRTGQGALAEICQAIDVFKRCHSYALRRECNEDAADVVEELYDHALGPLKKMINCSGAERRGASMVVWLITAVAAVLVSAAT